MILLILLAHPNLVQDHAEDLATLDFMTAELVPFRDVLLDSTQEDAGRADIASPSALRAHLVEAGFAPILAKLDRSGAGSVWYLRPDSAPQDAAAVLRQALTLHRKARALHKELLSAELALATDASEANMARMRDIQEQLGALTGMEAAIEGFGVLSGRQAPVL